MDMRHWSNYVYTLVREEHDRRPPSGDTDRWEIYIVKASSDKDAQDRAERHAEILTQELLGDSVVDSTRPWSRKHWSVHTVAKIDMSKIAADFPVLVLSFTVPMGDSLASLSRSDVIDDMEGDC